MPDFPDFQGIANSFQTFRANPTPGNRMAIRTKVAPFQSENPTDYSAGADLIIAALDNAYATTGQIHAALVEAANLTGVDIQTLGGGNTPD